MKTFSEIYQDFSNVDLIRIIQNAGDYQPEAVEAAKAILANRNLTNSEIEQAKDILIEAENEIDSKIDQRRRRVKQFVGSMVGSPGNMSKAVLLLTIVLCIMFLYSALSAFNFLEFTIKSKSWDFYSTVLVAQLVFQASMIYLFFKQKKAGWIMVAFFTSFSTLLTAYSVYFTISHMVELSGTGFPLLEDYPFRTNLLPYVVSILFYLAIFIVICKKEIRMLFQIDKKHIFNVSVISIILCMLMIVLSNYIG